ncbi:cysteine--tRNA ligase [Acidaminobacter sp. JC074]|uniref:cysteine--tRNA ligase n=1 Tax=Acidaminobacter sp. JC074 TaxID=2530199 RepID=UPI001F0CFDC7|nr:cysteine--tRNA ligase [Acidaminobacter sp. JC074]MCH4890461.1 cysteine--tRNA ligase [Acidaminobacter sp. JC074]
MRLYNTITREKEEFKPLEEGKVKMYVCGPTVYNYFHIGNARPFLIFDAFRRYLEYRGYDVTYVQNFTDVDDKIINRAIEENIDPMTVSQKYIDEYFKDADALGIKRADFHPKVSENIGGIIKIVKTLEKNGYAYNVDGDVYFDMKAFKDYGKLSGQIIDELEAGARIDVSEVKKNPMDFALWKKKKEGEIAWKSPWGEGRPGWHIECSAMINKHLGETIDIHAGGKDLVFPHHENEVAQSEAYTGKTLSNYWMHNGYINIDNKKMSKSEGNFFTVREILEKYDAEVIRFFLLSVQYRHPVNFSRELVESAANGLDRIYTARDNMMHLLKTAPTGLSDSDQVILDGYQKHKIKFIESLDDDFNTADGIAAIFELVRDMNKDMTELSSRELILGTLDLLKELTGVLGILVKENDVLADDLKALIDERQEARKAKNFERSDEIRDLLLEKGIVLEDTPTGVKWSYKR